MSEHNEDKPIPLTDAASSPQMQNIDDLIKGLTSPPMTKIPTIAASTTLPPPAKDDSAPPKK